MTTFNIKKIVYLSLGFILFTVIGTLSHESGHYAAARYFGYDAVINYGHCRSTDTKNEAYIDSLENTYPELVHSGKFFPGKIKYDSIIEKWRRERRIISAAGPFQTMLTGTIAFLILLWLKRRSPEPGFKQWIFIFFSLFWLRQVFNMGSVLAGYFKEGVISTRGDETTLAASLDLPLLSILLPTALIGTAVSSYIVFVIIPEKDRKVFIVSAILGGGLGFYLWLILLGPKIMP